MQAGKSFTYMFEDTQWPSKTLIGALVGMVPILNFAWLGYLIGVLKNVSRGENTLPLWDDFSDKFMDGLKIGVASLIYTLPATILVMVAAVVFIIPAIAQDQDMQAILMGGASLAYLLLCSIVGLYFLVFSFFVPAISIHFARVGTFKSCFEVGHILDSGEEGFQQLFDRLVIVTRGRSRCRCHRNRGINSSGLDTLHRPDRGRARQRCRNCMEFSGKLPFIRPGRSRTGCIMPYTD